MSYQHASQYGLDSDPDNWLLHAACRDYDPEWWTLGTDKAGRDRNDAAVRICLSCPVRQRCLDYGQHTRSKGVIFGGQRLLEGAVETRRCDNCGADYMPVISFQRYCGERCGTVARQRKYELRRVRARCGR